MQLPTGPIGKLNQDNKNVTIIGAGVSGLLMGYYLQKAGLQVSILEKNPEVGGKINTINTSYGPAETAANAIFTNDDVLELVNELGLTYSCAPHTLKKYVWRNGKGKTPPFTILELIRIIFGAFKKIDKTNLSKKTVYEFFSPMMGKFFAGEVMSAALGGIYAQSTRVIHFQSLFKTPFTGKRYYQFFLELMKKRKERSKSKAQSIGFDGGMKTFTSALKDHLQESIIYNNEVHTLDDNTIICTDATSASKIIKYKSPKISNLLAQIKYNSMYTSTVFTSKPIPILNGGFGVVIPPGENFKNLGILNNSEIFPKRTVNNEQYSYTFMTRATDNVNVILNDELERIAGAGFAQNIVYRETTQWKQAIPIYDINRFESVMQVRSEMNNLESGTVLFGNYIDGISIREIISHAKTFAKSL